MMIRLKSAVEDRPFRPATCTVKLALAVDQGVPLITPALLRIKPGGRLPAASDHVYGVSPPLAVKVWLYGTVAAPEGSGPLAVVMTGGPMIKLIPRFWPVPVTVFEKVTVSL